MLLKGGDESEEAGTMQDLLVGDACVGVATMQFPKLGGWPHAVSGRFEKFRLKWSKRETLVILKG